MPPHRVGDRRISLFEAINRIEASGDEYIFQLMKKIEQHEIASAGFRWHATPTQNNQDRVLALFERFLRLTGVIPSMEETRRLTQREKDTLMFPIDQQKLLAQLRGFMFFVADQTAGKSADNLTYMALSKYRAAMLFWIYHVYNRHQLTPPA
ncbi:hypothetical protein PFICI_13738 [Pestalotiopsis fici W106-1]|uniref:Uncharacterized protein n=1 Tax=Pestalotiopsis fici (strain W106-1 / CGMCC3.15140) TaxID=1229662 RepID=W3WNA8_PESFW|nr:uncharacterized protein PFICI_13738 [Pestalotiopsis fici W106-1]ETS75254.1 hypothetical protein PFICI_13738 [Pestalotiopsis fici W106-1]